MYSKNFYFYKKQNNLNLPSESLGTLWGWNLRMLEYFGTKKFLVCTQQNKRTAKLKHFNVTTRVKNNEMDMQMADIDN